MTELLGGFAGLVRARQVRQIEPQIALLALLTFVIICATWIDAWAAERNVTLDFAGLWAPILIGTFYYLAASVVFPRNADSAAALATYYAERKGFVVLMLALAEVLVSVTYIGVYSDLLEHRPAVFWLWQMPYKTAIFTAYGGIWLSRSRRANIAWLAVGLALFLVPYWQYAAIREAISRAYGYG